SDLDGLGGEGVERGVQGGLQSPATRPDQRQRAFQFLIARLWNELFHGGSCLFAPFGEESACLSGDVMRFLRRRPAAAEERYGMRAQLCAVKRRTGEMAL